MKLSYFQVVFFAVLNSIVNASSTTLFFLDKNPLSLESKPNEKEYNQYLLKSVLESNPTAENIRLINLFDNGFPDSAIEEAVHFLLANPFDIEVRTTLAKFYSTTQKQVLANQQLNFIALWKLWHDNNQIEQAIQQVKDYLIKNPDDLNAVFIQGQFYFLIQDYQLAQNNMVELLKKEPANSAARILLIETYIAMGNYFKADEMVVEGLKWNPNQTTLFTEKSLIQHSRNIFRGRTENNPILFNRLWQTWDKGYYNKAIHDAIEYLSLYPEDLNINLVIGQFYYSQKDYFIANNIVKPIIEKDLSFLAARETLINISFALKDYSYAQYLINQGFIMDPMNALLIEKNKELQQLKKYLSEKDPQAEYDYIWGLWNSHQEELAINQTQNYLEKHPDDAEIGLSLGQFYLIQKNYSKALQQIKIVVDKYPAYIAAIMSLVDTHAALNQYDEALKTVNHGLFLFPGDKGLLASKKSLLDSNEFSALWKLWNAGNQNEAISRAQAYLQTNPNNAEINLSLGQFYLLQKKYPQALSQIKSILNKDPNYINARISLIDVYIALKNYDQASELLAEGIKRSPEDQALQDETKILINAKNGFASSTMPQIPAIQNGNSLSEFNSLWHLWNTGKHQVAKTKAQDYLLKNPTDGVIRLSLGQFYFLEKKYPAAITQVRLVLDKDPKYIAARTTLIEIYIATKDYDKARNTLNEGLISTPKDPQLLAERTLIVNAQKSLSIAKKTNESSASVVTPLTSYIEGGVQYAKLSAGYPQWFNQYLRGLFQTDAHNSWLAELNHGSEFGQKAFYAIVQKTHDFNDTWYGNLSAGISDNSIFVPKYYAGATLFRKTLKSKRLVPYLGFQAYWFRPIYSLQVLNPGLIYYFEKPWTVELGAYLNSTSPGPIYTAVSYVAITQGRDKKHYLTGRVAWGRVGYLPEGTNVNAVGYPSFVFTGTWRQWAGKNWGWNVIGETYFTPPYNRYSIALGLFKEFSL